MRWQTNFYDFRFKWTATVEIGIHSTWLAQLMNIKNAIWIWGHFRTYAMLQTAFRPSCINRTSGFEWHKRFKEDRETVRDDERCRRSKEVNTPELIGQRLGLGLLCWGFKGVQQEIPWASTLQIGLWHFTRTIHQSTTPSLSQTIWPR